MASARLGPLVTDVRGSVGDVTFGRNMGGIFARARTSPAQPASAERDLRQAAMAAITTAWSATLTQPQRDAWNQYGRTHLLPNRWGTLGTRPGFLHFIRCNVQHYRLTTTIINHNAPPDPPAPIPSFTFTADASANNFVLDMPPANHPDMPTSSFLYAYAGRDLSPGRVFYAGPWRYIGWNMKTAGGFLFAPWTLAYPWTLTATHHVYARLVVMLVGGPISFAGQTMTTVVP